jgi:ResB-like family
MTLGMNPGGIPGQIPKVFPGVIPVSKAIKKVLSPIASLRLTVVLFALAMILIFAGTVVQKDVGNWAAVNTYFRSLWLWMPIGIAGLKVPFIGGYTIGGLMVLNLLAAHTVRFKFTWKRVGIILTHAGLIMLIVGEVLTGVFSVEWQMRIDEGQSANYAVDIREVELAIVDPAPKGHDAVVALPQSILESHANGIAISDTRLPFDIQVLRWMPNSAIAGLGMADPQLRQSNPATDGFGKIVVAVPQPRISGVEGGQVDAPSAYIRLSKAGETLGTWLVSLNAERLGDETRQPVTVGDKTYLIELRFRRDYKPYTITLIDFTHDKFVGTEIPKNFASKIRLVDPTVNEDRTALIYMNHPLRHRPLNSRGETLYQSGYFGDATTILQVVRNPSWLVPYIACALVTLGLMVHFGVMLIKFVERTRR